MLRSCPAILRTSTLCHSTSPKAHWCHPQSLATQVSPFLRPTTLVTFSVFTPSGQPEQEADEEEHDKEEGAKQVFLQGTPAFPCSLRVVFPGEQAPDNTLSVACNLPCKNVAKPARRRFSCRRRQTTPSVAQSASRDKTRRRRGQLITSLNLAGRFFCITYRFPHRAALLFRTKAKRISLAQCGCAVLCDHFSVDGELVVRQDDSHTLQLRLESAAFSVSILPCFYHHVEHQDHQQHNKNDTTQCARQYLFFPRAFLLQSS